MTHHYQRFSRAQDYSDGLAHLNFRYTIQSHQTDSLTISHIHQLDNTVLTYSVVNRSQGIFTRVPNTSHDYLGLRFIRYGHEIHASQNNRTVLSDYTIGIFDLNTISTYDRLRPTESLNLFIEKNGHNRNLLGPADASNVLDASQGLGRFLLESFFTFEEQFHAASQDENKLILHHLISLLTEWVLQTTPPSDDNQLLNQAADYIRSYLWDTTLSIERTARFCQTSVRTLQKAFYLADLSFSHYVKDARLALAAVKLFQTNQPATSIAFQCGFNNSAYFSKCFKEKYHLSPVQYRKKVQKLVDLSTIKVNDCPLVQEIQQNFTI
ncbi:helix-turn-helix transcriptional regulator [Enterococcus sp. AZ109]|uniref:helix-turn-helix transcriptional regulator n=1 Tax=Enterococcus sp. AZ109 TaxID=2774634 RepID=UPI003F24ED8C